MKGKTMKKTYLKPSAEVVRMGLAMMVCTSDSIKASINGKEEMGYGGVDDDGTLDPASRRRRNVWDEEEEDDVF